MGKEACYKTQYMLVSSHLASTIMRSEEERLARLESWARHPIDPDASTSDPG